MLTYFKPLFSALILFVFTSITCLTQVPNYLNHDERIKELNNNKTVIFYNIIQEYDKYIELHPSEVLVEIEKCKFANNAMFDEYGEVNLNQEYADSCLEKLQGEYPDNPIVLVYLSNLFYGEKLEEVHQRGLIAVRNKKEQWSDLQLGEFYYNLANKCYYEDDYINALKYILHIRKH